VLVLSHKEKPRAYKLFWFGLLVSVLYASIYSFYPDIYLLYILLLTSLAILTQYFHMRAVEAGRTKPMKHVVDITKTGMLGQKGSVEAKRRRKR
jgi:phosphatidylglycerophosphate synthase